MQPESPYQSTIPWETGSKGELPIVWGHAGIKDCDAHIKEEYGSVFCRDGKIILTVQGKPTHQELGTKLEPGRWNVTLIGSRAGAEFVAITSDVNSQELEPHFIRKVSRHMAVSQLQSCGASTDGSILYRVASQGKKPMFIIESYSCGSGGCSIYLLTGFSESGFREQMKSGCR